VARAGAAGRTRHMPAVGATLFIRRWTATPERVCSQVSPPSAAATVDAEYSLETFAQRLGLDRPGYMGAAPGVPVRFGCRAEKVNFWCRVGVLEIGCLRQH
jgi:hypothetical protein